MKEQKSDLLDQRYVLLDISYQSIKESLNDLEAFSEVVLNVDSLLEEEKTEANADKIEQLLLSFYQNEQLNVEFSRRLVDAEKELDKSVYKFYKNSEGTCSLKEKKLLLDLLVEDLQKESNNNHIRQNYYVNVSIKAAWSFVFTMVLFFLPEISDCVKGFLVDAGMENNKAYYLYTGMVAGAMGAVFSMLISLKKRLHLIHIEDITKDRSVSDVATKMVTGWGSGLLFFYFLQAGLLVGGIFPDMTLLNGPTSDLNDVEQKSFALMIIWCFLSGFSEKLVPNLLAKTSKQTP